MPVKLEQSPHEHGVLYAGVVPEDYESGRRFTRAMFRTLQPIPWNSLNPGSTDDTEVGVAVAWLRCTAPEES